MVCTLSNINTGNKMIINSNIADLFKLNIQYIYTLPQTLSLADHSSYIVVLQSNTKMRILHGRSENVSSSVQFDEHKKIHFVSPSDHVILILLYEKSMISHVRSNREWREPGQKLKINNT